MAPRDQLGGPWEKPDGLEMVVYRIFFDFGFILGLVCMSFLISRKLHISYFDGLVSRSYFYRFLNRNVDAWDFQVEVFARKVLHKSTFHGNRFQ